MLVLAPTAAGTGVVSSDLRARMERHIAATLPLGVVERQGGYWVAFLSMWTQPSPLCHLLRRLCTLRFPWNIWVCKQKTCSCKISQEIFGGASRDRTDGLVVANDALSQLSYSPLRLGFRFSFYQPYSLSPRRGAQKGIIFQESIRPCFPFLQSPINSSCLLSNFFCTSARESIREIRTSNTLRCH